MMDFSEKQKIFEEYMFFKNKGHHTFFIVRNLSYKYKCDEEDILWILTDVLNHKYKNDIKKQIIIDIAKEMNICMLYEFYTPYENYFDEVSIKNFLYEILGSQDLWPDECNYNHLVLSLLHFKNFTKSQKYSVTIELHCCIQCIIESFEKYKLIEKINKSNNDISSFLYKKSDIVKSIIKIL